VAQHEGGEGVAGLVEGPFGTPVPESRERAQLKADELSLFDATAVAVSSVAPAYSLATALGSMFIIASVGDKAPAMVILSFIPILFIAYAYFHLNRRNPNCGASYAWLSEIIHPAAGWFNGFLQVGISVIFCVQSPIVAAGYTLAFFNALGWISGATARSTLLTALIASAWLVLITFFCIYGIRWTTNFQWVLCIIEYLAVVVFSIGGIIKVAVSNHQHRAFHAAWLNPFGVHGLGNIATALAVGTFLFWGWDTAVNLNEETKAPGRTPGRAAILSMWLILGVFLLNFVAAQLLLTPDQLGSDNLLFVFGVAFAGKWAGYVMIFAVLSSSVATAQTTLLPAARITYSMARDEVFPQLFAKVHGTFKTPAIGTAVLGAFAMVGIWWVQYTGAGSNVIATFTNNVGAIVAFYYGIAGIACAWAFRRALVSWRFALTGIVLPFISGVVLIAIMIWDIKSNGWSGMKWDILLLVLSAVLTPFVWAKRRSVAFFNQPLVAYTSQE